MKKINSFVRRNGRLSQRQKESLHQQVYLVEKLSDIDGFAALEIGFGMGDSLLQTASDHPEQTWVGIEVYERGVASVIRQAKEKKLENIILRVGDVVEIIDQEVNDHQFDLIRIFFPDPWHKKRHHKRRLINQSFLTTLHRVLKPSGLLHIATDNLHYAESCQLLISEHPGFEISDQVLERPMTKFAKKAIAAQSIITDLVVSVVAWDDKAK